MNRSLPCGYYFLQKIDYSKEITRAGCFLICSKRRENKHAHTETNKQTNKGLRSANTCTCEKTALCCLHASCYFCRKEDRLTSDETRINAIEVTGSQITSTDVKQPCVILLKLSVINTIENSNDAHWHTHADPHFVHLTSPTPLKNIGSTGPTNPIIADGELAGWDWQKALCCRQTLWGRLGTRQEMKTYLKSFPSWITLVNTANTILATVLLLLCLDVKRVPYESS